MSINIGFMYTCVLFSYIYTKHLLQPLYGTPDFLESNSVKFLTVLHLLHCGILSEMILSEGGGLVLYVAVTIVCCGCDVVSR